MGFLVATVSIQNCSRKNASKCEPVKLGRLIANADTTYQNLPNCSVRVFINVCARNRSGMKRFSNSMWMEGRRKE